jgi:hypothetical protein
MQYLRYGHMFSAGFVLSSYWTANLDKGDISLQGIHEKRSINADRGK